MSSLPARAFGRRPLTASTLAAVILIVGSVALAQGAAIDVTPPGPLAAGATTLTVTGQGFQPAGNGVYVVFGPITPAPRYYQDPSIYGAFKWVHAGAADSALEAPLAADGSFSTTLDITSSFVTPAGQVDCAVTACAVITFAAHGSPDRTQDTCRVVTFGTVIAPSGAPVTSPEVARGTAATGSVNPLASPLPPAGDPCAAIGPVAP